MALNPIRPRLRNHSNGLAKIAVALAPGDEIEVSEDVAAQIADQRVPLSETVAPAKAPAKKAAAKKAAPKAQD